MTLLAQLAPSSFPVVGPIVDIVAQLILLLWANTGRNLGVTIIIFTILIKTALLPLTLKSIRSSKAMQDVAPILKQLQKKHKDDRQEFAKAQMEVYQQYGINPLSGCLPVLIQLPVFIIVYNAMLAVVQDPELGVQPFLWVSDLTKNIGHVDAGAPAFQFLLFSGNVDPFRILPFLAFLFQVIQTRMSLPTAEKAAQQDQQTRAQRSILTASTALVLVFGWTFLAAMVLYWAAQAVYSAVQQYFITGFGSLTDLFPFLPKKVEKVRELKPIDPSQRKPPGRFARMLQEAQAQQGANRPAATDEGRDEEAQDGDGGQPVKPRQPLTPSGRPPRGSTVSISGGGGSTPPQRGTKSGEANRAASRTKGAEPRPTTARAIGAAESSDGGGRTVRVNRVNGNGNGNGTGKEPIIVDPRPSRPVPRRSGGGDKATNRTAGNESASGGGE